MRQAKVPDEEIKATERALTRSPSDLRQPLAQMTASQLATEAIGRKAASCTRSYKISPPRHRDGGPPRRVGKGEKARLESLTSPNPFPRIDLDLGRDGPVPAGRYRCVFF